MEREINIEDVVKYLSRSFFKAATKASQTIGNKTTRTKNKETGKFETTLLYDYQVEFCYIVDNIQRRPRYISTKNIQLANELISKLEAEADKL